MHTIFRMWRAFSDVHTVCLLFSRRSPLFDAHRECLATPQEGSECQQTSQETFFSESGTECQQMSQETFFSERGTRVSLVPAPRSDITKEQQSGTTVSLVSALRFYIAKDRSIHMTGLAASATLPYEIPLDITVMCSMLLVQVLTMFSRVLATAQETSSSENKTRFTVHQAVLFCFVWGRRCSASQQDARHL
jgi:hypothetical protein